MHDPIDAWIRPFSLHPAIRAQVVEVLLALPTEVRLDLMGDGAFVLCDYEGGAGGVCVTVGTPGAGRPGRSVALKRALRHRAAEFARYVIAHELAHAYLRNEGRWPGEDPEHAADALAAQWGFPRTAWR